MDETTRIDWTERLRGWAREFGFASLGVADLDAAAPGRHFFLPALRRRLRIAIDTSPKSMSTGHGFTHL